MADDERNPLGLDDADLSLIMAADVPGKDVEEKILYIVHEFLSKVAVDGLIDLEPKGKH